MAADDVATAVGRVAVGQPLNGIVEIGGPEQFRVDELVRRRLVSLKDPASRLINARYSGAKLSEKTLVPGKNARLGETRFETWLTQPQHKFRVRILSHSRRAVAKEKESRKKLADIATAYATDERGMEGNLGTTDLRYGAL